ncbi:UMP kinase [Candidatus Parcubacteria bacterium]|nr:UMP kinase [Candidatus Parcubacteria bacterium]
MKNHYYIVSLGGSLVCPDGPDFNFLKKFSEFILKWTKKGKKFVIFVGGGKIARIYQKVARRLGVKNSQILDKIGISATLLNANLLLSLFGNQSFFEVQTNPKKIPKTKKKILIFGGYKPGWSTDYDAVLAAKTLKVKSVLNLTNVDFVYDKDPRKFPNAKPIKKISFQELLKIIGKKWKAGGNFPFDPKATILAKKEKIKIFLLNGRNFENLDNFLKGKDFLGTEIS